MKASRSFTFVALTAMFFAALTLAHVDFQIYGPDVPWYVLLNGSRLILAGFLSLGLTTILFHFKK